MPIDGIWRLWELGKQVAIDQGRVIALEGWMHMFLWSVKTGMVTSSDLRADGPGRCTAYDNLLKSRIKWHSGPSSQAPVKMMPAIKRLFRKLMS